MNIDLRVLCGLLVIGLSVGFANSLVRHTSVGMYPITVGGEAIVILLIGYGAWRLFRPYLVP